jgi:hypothetical protein
MATKTSIQNLINSLIRSNPALIDKTEHADVEDALLSNAYGTIITETRTTTTAPSRITNPNLIKPDITYSIRIVKQGRLVFISGFVFNQTDEIISNNFTDDFVFNIIDSEYLPSASSPFLTFPTAIGTFVDLKVGDNNFYVNQLGAGTSVDFNIHYFTEN